MKDKAQRTNKLKRREKKYFGLTLSLPRGCIFIPVAFDAARALVAFIHTNHIVVDDHDVDCVTTYTYLLVFWV